MDAETHRKLQQQGRDDYDKAKATGLVNDKRWEEGVPHHPMSVRLVAFLQKHDWEDNDGYFDWRTGGDGDNGETLMIEMDPFFELLDAEQQQGDGL